MHTEIEGPAGSAEGAPPLVLLHGGIGTARSHWSKLIPSLAERFQVYLPDLPGHGQSPLDDGVDYGMETLVAPVQDLLERLSETHEGGVHVAGFSMGGHTALTVAGRRPELFASLTLIGVSVRDHDGLDAWRRQFTPETFEARNPLWSRYLSKVHAPLGGPDAWREVLARDSSKVSAGADLDALGALACPVLLVRGDRDWAVQPEQFAELRELWGERSEELVVPHGGHDVQITRWRIVLPALLDFLERAAG